VIAGIVVAAVVMMVVEFANGRVFYPGFAEQAVAKDREAARAAEGADALRLRREAMREVMANAPTGALLVVVIGWALGSFAGGFAAALISRRPPLARGLVLGSMLMLLGVLNNLMLPPPVWFWLLTFIAFVPAALAGSKVASAAMAR
jgi:pimeloyl-ACP methyl ester carboxylesterase